MILQLSLGACRSRDGYTVLMRRQSAEERNVAARKPTLDEIMIHLDKEDAQ